MPQPRLCLITGANSGLGKVTALALAKQGFDLVMLCRDMIASRPAQDEIRTVSLTGNVALIRCDLADLTSVRWAADEIHHRYDRVDVLINNAGRIVDTLEYSPEGTELTFASNYLGHFLLTNLLVDLLRGGDKARVINVASELHRIGSFDLANLVKRTSGGYSAVGAYSDSKIAKLLFTFELADRLMDDGITVNALHPWLVDTNFAEDGDATGLLYAAFVVGKFFAPKPTALAETHIFLAASPDVEDVTGLYFANCKPYPPSNKAQNWELGKQLWALSEQLTGIDAVPEYHQAYLPGSR